MFKACVTVFFLLVLCSLATTAPINLNVQSLPYTAALNDSIYLTGNLTCGTKAITIPNNSDNVYVNGNNYEIKYATTSGVDNVNCIDITAGSNCAKNINIFNIKLVQDTTRTLWTTTYQGGTKAAAGANIVKNPSSGTDSMFVTVVSATYTRVYVTKYEVKITIDGTPDQFQWRRSDDSGNTWTSWSADINCNTTAIALGDGFGGSVRWNSTTAMALNTVWTFNITPATVDDAVRPTTYTATSDTNIYFVEVNPDTSLSPDQFRWKLGVTGSWSSYQNMAITPISIGSEGLQVQWGEVTRHEPDGQWAFLKDAEHSNCNGVGGSGVNVTMTNVTFINGNGTDVHAVSFAGRVGNILMVDCNMYDSMALLTDRHSVGTGACVTQPTNPIGAVGDVYETVTINWHLGLIRCKIYNTPARGVTFRYACFAYGCKFYGNLNNPANTGQEGNAFLMNFRGAVPTGTKKVTADSLPIFVGMRACTLWTTPAAKGCRGVHINGTDCTVANNFFLDSNIIDISLGPNGESQGCFLVQIEADASTSKNKNIYAKHNLLIATGDDSAATAHIGNSPEPVRLIPTNADTNIFFDSNTVYVIFHGAAVQQSDGVASAVVWQFTGATAPAPNPTEFDSTITFRWNNVNTGIPAFSNSRSVVEGNTIRKLGTDSCATNTGYAGCLEFSGGYVSNYASGTRDTGAWFIDNTFINMVDTTIRFYATSTSHYPINGYVARRATITVVDNGSNPVSGANVSVKDKNGKVWFTGTTNASGQVRAISPYYYKVETNVATYDTVYNPYKIYANTGGANDSTTVSWSTSVGSATVVLNTVTGFLNRRKGWR